ncbi:MAG: type pilus assembly protein PilM [Solirubrobacteraceae bacterium]|jgi:type IV pilus assembly protein PilM|nr:type pilus assembly protein PilM [Solirubrobacteraceae bacterium]
MTASIMALTLRKPQRRSTGPRGRSTVVGLDIEPGRVVAAEVSVNGNVCLQRVASADLSVGVVRDGEVVDIEAVSTALKQLWSDHKGLGREVRIGIANAKIVVRTVDVPPVTDPAQIDAAVRQVAADELPMPMESAVLDYEPTGIVDTANGPRQRVVLIAARKEMVEAVVAAATGAGLKPRGVDLSAFAMIRVLGGGRPDSALYLSVGGLANLAVVVDGICLFTRVTGAGLEGMAIELAERRSLTLEHARMWLRHVGFESHLAEVDGDPAIVADARTVLVDGTRRLASEVRASLEFHQTQAVSGAEVERAILTGAAVAVPGFADALAAELGMPVETRSVTAADNVAKPSELAGMTVAAGLAIAEVSA